MSTPYSFFIAAGKGTVPLLVEELRALGAGRVAMAPAGVACEGTLQFGYRACLWTRTASRVLLQLTRFPAPDAEALYAGIQSLDWTDHLAASGTLAVDCSLSQSAIGHSHFAALKVKDAIVDQFRARTGTRPSVAREHPDLRIHVRIHRNQASVSLDLSGASLHRRGYRSASLTAPLKEHLAAAVLLQAGWPALAKRGVSLIDPMCGSGTLPIEGALMAADIAPGLLREHFGFLRWPGHDPSLWDSLLAEARERRLQGLRNLPPIFGYDAEVEAVEASLTNLAGAGLKDRVSIARIPISACRAPATSGGGLLVVNPPYGERLGDARELAPLYRTLGKVLWQRFAGWEVAVLSGNPSLESALGRRPVRSHTFYNGNLECRLLRFPAEPRAARRTFGEDRSQRPTVAAGETSLLLESDSNAEMFANRLAKNIRHLKRWAQRQEIGCYRIYDADLPEYAFAIDLYQSEKLWVHVQEYTAPPQIDPAKAGIRLAGALKVLPAVLEVAPQQVIYKARYRQKKGSQYPKMAWEGRFHEVQENGCRFLVNLTDYLDTGLFLDHRLIRDLIRSLAAGRRFLNLFAYTGTGTVHAAAGGASTTTTVDLSHTFLAWARSNLVLNGFAGNRHEFLQADCLTWLAGQRRRYDLILLDPPTFSNSKRMRGSFDVQRDHVALIRAVADLLARNGILIFSTHCRRFRLDTETLGDLQCEDLSQTTLPRDFARNPRIHQCWKITQR